MADVTLSAAIKELVEKVSLKEMSNRDFVKEMEALYAKVDGLEASNKSLTESLKLREEQLKKVADELADYRVKYVTPAEEWRKKDAELMQESREWKVDKKFVERENTMLREILTQVTTFKTVSQSGNGNSWYENPNKPSLPALALNQ